MTKPKISVILVPVDFSSITERVLEYALLIARQNQATIALLHAVHIPPLAESSTWLDPVISPSVEQNLRLHLKSTAEVKLTALQERCGQDGVTANFCIREGVPYGEIIKCAEDQHADLIVMGSEGHSAVTRFLMGSTAERVVRRSHFTVLCVKPEEEKE